MVAVQITVTPAWFKPDFAEMIQYPAVDMVAHPELAFFRMASGSASRATKVPLCPAPANLAHEFQAV